MSEFDEGYKEALEDVIKSISNVIENPVLDTMPSSVALKILRAGLTQDVEELNNE
jgi:hypothetical protein